MGGWGRNLWGFREFSMFGVNYKMRVLGGWGFGRLGFLGGWDFWGVGVFGWLGVLGGWEF